MTRLDLINYIEHTPNNFNPVIYNNILDDYLNNIYQFYEKSNLTKIEDYLYSIQYDDINYDAGVEYCKQHEIAIGDCSAAYINGIHGRNYDFNYDNTVHFVVQVSATPQRHASIGLAAIRNFNKTVVETGKWNEFYSILPNITLDGMNDAGVVCNINLAPNGDYGYTTGTDPKKEGLCGIQVIRYILDNANSVDHAIELLQNRNIWMPHSNKIDEECHFLISDATKSVVIEFIHNKMIVLDHNMITNFYIYGVTFNNDGSVYTPATQTETKNAITMNNITSFGCGLERYNIINNELNNIDDVDGMINLMKSLYYTNTYTANPNDETWYTEMVGVNNLTVASTPEMYQPIFEGTYNWFEHRSRDTATTWHTVHTSVYDMASLTLTILNQEGTTEYQFTL